MFNKKTIKFMKKRFFTVATVTLLAGSVAFTSCIGSFNLSNKLLSWNKSLDNKFVNEVVFLAMWIVPVYEICALADMLVLNSIEFWTGDNPMQAGIVKEVQGENGTYMVETLEDGYSITDEKGETMSLLYDKGTNIWSAASGNDVVKLVKIEDGNAIVYLPNGEERNIALTADGVISFRQSIENYAYFAVK